MKLPFSGQAAIRESAPDATDNTSSLLRYLGSPHQLIDHVDEKINLGSIEASRTVSCVFKPGALVNGSIVDILRPRKGSISNLVIKESSAHFRRIPHAEHVRISRDLIYRRFAQMLNTVEIPSTASYSRTKIVQRFMDTLEELLALIDVHPDDADIALSGLWVKVKRFSVESMSFAWLDEYDGLAVDSKELGLLYSLCKMLSTHYLSLYEITGVGSNVSVTYQYSHALTTSPEPERVGRPKKFVRAAAKNIFQSLPVDARIHIPMAKKAHHYSISITPPDHHILYKAVVLSDRSESSQAASSRAKLFARRRSAIGSLESGWAATLKHGRAASVFVAGGPAQANRLYLGVKLAAEPWGATARTLMTTTVQLATFAIFTFFIVGARPATAGLSALVVSVLSLMANMTKDEFPSNTLFQSPLQSRIVRLVSMCLVIPFAGWILSRGTTYHWGYRVFAREWSNWTAYGGLVITCVMATLMFASLRRFIITIGRLGYVMAGRSDRNLLYTRKVAR